MGDADASEPNIEAVMDSMAESGCGNGGCPDSGSRDGHPKGWPAALEGGGICVDPKCGMDRGAGIKAACAAADGSIPTELGEASPGI